jgi:hypothetical protein
MSTDTAMVPVNFDHIPSTQIGTDDQFAELAKGGDYLARMQLYTKSKANLKGLIPTGHYGIPESDEEIIDLGDSVDLLPLARRPKAIDMSDMEALVISYDMESEEFKRIQEKSKESDSHCQWGVSFLVYERSTRRFLEFFCGNKSSRIESKKLFPFLPLRQEAIDALEAAGNDVSDLEPHGPVPVTLKVSVAENNKGVWHVPLVSKCSTPFMRLPSGDVLCREIAKFLAVKDNGVEKVQESKPARAR